MDNILTEHQRSVIDKFKSKYSDCDDILTDTVVSTHHMNSRELYERLKSDPKFDACYKQALSERNSDSGKLIDSGYPDDDPVLLEAREYVAERFGAKLECDDAPEDKFCVSEDKFCIPDSEPIGKPQPTQYISISRVETLNITFQL